MKITSLKAGFGARIEEVDLNALQAEEADQLRAALLSDGILVIPRQAMSFDEQIAVSKIFGTLEVFPPAPGQVDGFPEIFRVASRAIDGYTNVGQYWHSDGSFRAVPTPITIWHLEALPEQGGDTLFTDLQAAYDTLSPENRQRFASLQTLHRNGVVHPLVLPHPYTSRAGLYLNIGLTTGIKDMRREEAAAVMREIDAHFSHADTIYRHAWEADDFVVADNFRVAHRATPVESAQRLVLNRTTVRADGVFWGNCSTKFG